MTDRPPPDIPASHYLVIDVVEGKDRGVRCAERWGLAIAEAASIHGELPRASVDEWAVSRVSDRWNGEVVYEQDWGHDPAGAEDAKKTIERDLETMDLPTFLAEYSIAWTPPEDDPPRGG